VRGKGKKVEEPDTAGRERGEDEIWQDLVSRLDIPDEDHDGEASPWPPQEDVDRWPDPARVIRPADTPATAGDSASPAPGETSTPPSDCDDHYVPPPPPPLPRLDGIAKGAWLALFGGPAYLLVTTIAGWQVSAWAAFCAVAAFVGGFITLVVRMGDPSRDDSDPDDGAAV
jgi:hypothetical protein